MFVLNNVPLNAYSTMRLGGIAAHLVEITTRFEAEKAVIWAVERELPFVVVGHGSNIVWRDEGFQGLVIVNKIAHFEIYEEDEETAYVTAGSGEIWDSVVERVVEKGWSGIETLSLIPGTAGATPVQNVGAYGTEIADCLMTVEAYDAQEQKFVTIRGSDCAFAYRTSRFKTTDKNRYVITGITFRVTRTQMEPPFYGALQRHLTEQDVTDYSPASIRQSVITIRQAKLPDPLTHPNNGSFFQNPIVPRTTISHLIDLFPELVYWEIDPSNVKVSAAWLLEHSGFKDFHDKETGMSTWWKQPLVLVNEGAHSTGDLIAFKEKIVGAVREKFGIELQQEPELLP